MSTLQFDPQVEKKLQEGVADDVSVFSESMPSSGFILWLFALTLGYRPPVFP